MDRRSIKPGFTLIELVVVILVLGILTTISLPNIKKRVPSYERNQFIAHLNSLLQSTWQHAILTHSPHKVVFDLEKRRIQIEEEFVDPKNPAKKVFKPIEFKYLKTKYNWAKNLTVKNFFVNNKDEFLSTIGRKKIEVWFFVSPIGLTEDVIINLVDTKDLTFDSKERQIGLILNPFKAQFKKYDTFQKPI